MKTIKLSQDYFNMIEVNKELFTFYNLHERYNINELKNNKSYKIELDEDTLNELERIHFQEFNNQELKVLNDIFRSHILNPDDSIWNMFEDAVENNLLSFDLITQYIEIYQDKKEYLNKVLGELHYYHEKKE